MEKYRKFADHTTGINPYIPAYSNARTTAAQYLLHGTLGFLLVLIRLPILLLLLTIAIVFNSVLLRLLYVPPIQRTLGLLINKVIFKGVLLTLGFFSIDEQHSQPLPNQPGSIILSNHSSPVDIFYYLSTCSPIFTRNNHELNGNTIISSTYRPLSFLDSVKQAFSLSSNIPEVGNASTLTSISQEYGERIAYSPVLIFFEGIQTNQSGVLEPNQPLIKDLAGINFTQNRLTVVVLTYTDRSIFTPINTTRNQFWNLLLLMTSLTNTLKVYSISVANQTDYRKTISQIYESQGYKPLQSNFRTYLDFLQFWEKTWGKKNYSKSE